VRAQSSGKHRRNSGGGLEERVQRNSARKLTLCCCF